MTMPPSVANSLTGAGEGLAKAILTLASPRMTAAKLNEEENIFGMARGVRKTRVALLDMGELCVSFIYLRGITFIFECNLDLESLAYF
jgi:hypothetical protein